MDEARRSVLETAFALLEKGRLPSPMPMTEDGDVAAYLSHCTRVCQRELFGMISSWRAPARATDWRPWPVLDGDEREGLMETVVLVCTDKELNLRVVHGAPKDRKASDGKRDVVLSEAQVALHKVLGDGSQALRKARLSSHEFSRSLDNSARAFGEPGERRELLKLLPSEAAHDFILLQRTESQEGSFVEAAADGHTASLPWAMRMVLKLPGDAAGGDTFYLNAVAGELNPFFCEIGYIGDLVSALIAASQLQPTETAVPSALLRSLAPGGERDEINWIRPGPLDDYQGFSLRLNESQHRALQKLENNIEIICGPPATGKSTTISALVRDCVADEIEGHGSPDAREGLSIESAKDLIPAALVVAVQNRAIEALAQKFEAVGIAFVVSGRRSIGVAKNWTLEAQVRDDGQVRQRQSDVDNPPANASPAKITELSRNLEQAKAEARNRILTSAKALLCTAAAVGPTVRSPMFSPLANRATIAVGDEAGSMGDMHVLPILAACPQLAGIVLIGDTNQLPLFTNLRDTHLPYQAPGANTPTVPSNSLMARLENSFAHKMLTVQYRMPAELAILVSAEFYGERLTSAPHAGAGIDRPLRFVDVRGSAEKEQGGTSLINEQEAVRAAQIANEFASSSPGSTVVVLCLYAAQGREWTHVILSLVSVDKRRCNFAKDRQRQCVAMSRAMGTMTLVAHSDVVAELPIMEAFRAAATGTPRRQPSAASGPQQHADRTRRPIPPAVTAPKRPRMNDAGPSRAIPPPAHSEPRRSPAQSPDGPPPRVQQVPARLTFGWQNPPPRHNVPAARWEPPRRALAHGRLRVGSVRRRGDGGRRHG